MTCALAHTHEKSKKTKNDGVLRFVSIEFTFDNLGNLDSLNSHGINPLDASFVWVSIFCQPYPKVLHHKSYHILKYFSNFQNM